MHEAVRLNHEKVEAMWKAQARAPFAPPATRRRFDEWFRVQQRVFEKAALLIVFGRITARRGAFSVFVPQFAEHGSSWRLGIEHIQVEFTAGRLEHVHERMLPVTIYGHALERLCQRTESIDWAVIRQCLAGATLFLRTGMAACVVAGCRQCAIPAEKGLLVGIVEEKKLQLKTFLPAANLQPRYESLRSELDRFAREHDNAIQTAALHDDPAAAVELTTRLGWTPFNWLREAYVPGRDAMDDAWESRAGA